MSCRLFVACLNCFQSPIHLHGSFSQIKPEKVSVETKTEAANASSGRLVPRRPDEDCLGSSFSYVVSTKMRYISSSAVQVSRDMSFLSLCVVEVRVESIKASRSQRPGDRRESF